MVRLFLPIHWLIVCFCFDIKESFTDGALLIYLLVLGLLGSYFCDWVIGLNKLLNLGDSFFAFALHNDEYLVVYAPIDCSCLLTGVIKA